MIFVLTGEKLLQYANEAYAQVTNGEKTGMKVNKVIEFTLSGLSSLNEGTIITVLPTVTSTTGVSRQTKTYDDSNVYTIPAVTATTNP